MRGRFVILIVLCTIFHNAYAEDEENKGKRQGRKRDLLKVMMGFIGGNGSPMYINPDWSSAFNPFLLPRISNFASWYHKHEEEGKADLDKLKISEEAAPMNLRVIDSSISSNISLTIKDSHLMHFGTDLRPHHISVTQQGSENILVITYLATNVSYTGKFSSKGTIFNKTISFDGEGQFDVKIHGSCTGIVVVKIETEIPMKVTVVDKAEIASTGFKTNCYALGKGESNFTGMLKNTSPEIKDSDKPGIERFLSSYLGTKVQMSLNQVMGKKSKMLGALFQKQVKDALKDVTIFGILNEWKPTLTDMNSNRGHWGGGGGGGNWNFSWGTGDQKKGNY